MRAEPRPPARRWYLIVSAIFAVASAAYLLVDLKLVLTGRHPASPRPDEYMFTALSIYGHIVWLFLNVLNIIGISVPH